MSMDGLKEARSRDALPMESGAEYESDEVRRRKEAERERDAASYRASEAARRAALARREAAEQRARAEAAEARAEAAEARAVEVAAEATAAASRFGVELARVAGERDALLRSTSWKVTRPLRAAGQRLPTGLKGAFRGGAGFVRRAARLTLPAGRQKSGR